MKKSTIEELAYFLKEAKKENQPAPIFFLGAGVSKSGGVPLASEIEKEILKRFADNPRIKKLPEKDRTYANLMEAIGVPTRNQLLKEYVDKAKINVAHIYIAQLMIEGYADYILTVNFDNLMQRALIALFNRFPPVYDMAILKDLTTSSFKEQSIVHLHGQHHGLWLLNTNEETDKVSEVIPPMLNKISHNRPWIFIGYSASDPIFEHIKKLGRFDNGLYWVTHNKEKPPKNVCSGLLDKPNTNSFVIEGYNADSFMLKLNHALGLSEPKIITKPFSYLESMLTNVVDIEDEDHFKNIKERLVIAKSQVAKAIQQFEQGEINSTEDREETSKINLLKNQIITLLITENYQDIKQDDLINQAKAHNNPEVNNLLSDLFYNWGTYLGNLAETQSGNTAKTLYQQAFDKFQKATEIKPDKHEAFNNWGTDLGNFAQTQSGNQAKTLYQQAFDKFQKATEIKPDDHKAFYNWGTDLGNLAQTQSGNQAETLYQQAFDKYQKATEIKPDKHEAFYNWGNALAKLAQAQSGKQAETLYQQAFEKFQKATEIKPDDHQAFNNWGIDLAKLAQTQSGDQAETLYQQAFDKFQKATEIKPDYHQAFNNWGTDLGKLAQTQSGDQAKTLYQQAFDKFQKATEIKPDKHEAFYNWGNDLGKLAQTQSGNQAKTLYQQAFDKFQKATEIKPDYHEAFNNWGNNLGRLAQTQSGDQSETLYQQAFDKQQQAIALGGNSYNLACLYALRQDKQNALLTLENALKRQEIKTAFVLEDTDWKALQKDEDFIALISQYKSSDK